MEAADRKKLIDSLGEFLRQGGMDGEDVAVYLHGLDKGALTASMVKAMPKVKGDPKTRLDRLAQDGFFDPTVGPGKKGQPTRYLARPPSIALKDRLSAASAIVRDIEIIDEVLEVGTVGGDEDAFSLSYDMEAAVGSLAASIDGASSHVQAYCRDASWWDDRTTREALVRAAERGVKVKIAGTAISGEHLAAMKAAKLDAVSTNAPMTPFFIVDGVSLFLPHRAGSLAYRGLRVQNKYLIENVAKFHDHCFNGGQNSQ